MKHLILAVLLLASPILAQEPINARQVEADLRARQAVLQNEQEASIRDSRQYLQKVVDQGTYQIRIDVYETPHDGWGYTITLQVVEGGKTLERVFNHGPEKYRETKWRDVTPPKELTDAITR